MIEDKWIGLMLAISSSFALGSSIVLTKMGLNSAGALAGNTSASDNYTYLRNPLWWAGMLTMVIGEVANFAAYTFAPPILITPLGALSVLIGAILASFILNESLGHLGRVGSALCLLGSLIIVLHAPADKEIQTVDEILIYALHPGFLLYMLTSLVFSLVMIYRVAPRYGRSNPLVYVSICSIVGSVSVMAVKGFGIAVKLTFNGDNQFTHPSTYVFMITVAGCIVVQMNYFNKALDTFSTNVVNPMYFVGFSSATIVASLILFQGFNTTDGSNTLSLLAGFFIIFTGVHLLNLSRQSESLEPDHSTLESGIMNPRLSLQGRPSIDGWTGMPITPTSATSGRRQQQVHGRSGSNSHYRSQSATLFDAFNEGGVDIDDAAPTGGVRDGVALNRISKAHPTTHRELEVTREEEEDETDEEEEEDEDEDEDESADERTQLRRDRPSNGKASGHISPGSLSRNHSRSPRI